MLRKIIVLTAVAALASACDHKKDKTAPKPLAKPGPTASPETKPADPIWGTADGELNIDGEKKKFEIRPEKAPLVNGCSIIQVQQKAGLEQQLNISFDGEVEGKKSKIGFKIQDSKVVDDIAAYLSEVQSDNYANSKSPLKVALASNKTTVSVTNLGGIPSATTDMDCSLEVVPSLVNRRSSYGDVKGQEQSMDIISKGAKLVLSCEDKASVLSWKLKGLEFSGYCAVSL